MWRGVPLVVALGVVCLCQVAVARIEVSVSWELYSSAEVQLPPRQQHAMSSIGDTIFLFGGLANGTADNSLHAFSTTTESWQDLSAATVTGPVPRARYGHGMEAIGEQLLVFGGIDSEPCCLPLHAGACCCSFASLLRLQSFSALTRGCGWSMVREVTLRRGAARRGG